MTRHFSRFGKHPLAIAVSALVSATAAHAAGYTAVPLTVSGGVSGDLIYPRALSDSGVVVGRTDGRHVPSMDALGALRTRAGAATTFAVDNQTLTEAMAIAPDGTIVGNAGSGPFDLFEAFLRAPDGSVQRLFDGSVKASATGVNNAHTVVGYVAQGTSQIGYVWQAGAVTWLPTLGGVGSLASAINEAGVVVGDADLPTMFHTHAFRWQGGVMTDLGTLPGDVDDTSSALAVNAQGTVVGHCGVTTMTACAWTPDGVVHDLGGLPGGYGSDAHAINDLGVTVGWALNHAILDRAVIFSGGVAHDLNTLTTLPDGVVLTKAAAINHAGVILATGVKGKVGVAYALIPK